MNKQSVSDSSVREAAKILKNGGTVVFPTDTVYGLGTSFYSLEGIKKIYKIKRRETDKPLIALISDTKYLDKLIDAEYGDIQDIKKITEKYWPGELTIIFKANENVPKNAVSNGSTIGIRIPKNEISLKIIENSGGIVFTTSANISGEKSPVKTQDISYDILEKTDFILDGGTILNGVPSTVIKYSAGKISVLREGNIKTGEILKLFMRRAEKK